ncbi:MAG: YkgJ family cysteine cluster protein [Candidatus Rhabdochlamydia sp.]
MTWYKKGLRFECTGCGGCCSKEPGYVWISPQEIQDMANYLQISEEEFLKTYTRSVFGRISLNEDRRNYDCVFLKNNRCQIYPARPKQCKTFPWWNENLESLAHWEEASKRCEGINAEAPLVPFAHIEKERTR